MNARYHFAKGCLAASAFADESKYLTLTHRETDIVSRYCCAKAIRKPL